MLTQVSLFFGQIMKYFYDVVGNYALSIILFTILTRLLLLPLTVSQMRSMHNMKKIQPEVDKINKKYKNDKNKQGEELAKLYREKKINPAAGCLPLVIQLPLIMSMYRVIQDPKKYVFVENPSLYDTIDKGFFWIRSLTEKDVLIISGFELPFILPILSAIFTYVQMKMSMTKSSTDTSKANDVAQSMSKSMTTMMPVMMLVWGVMFPSGLILYWVVGTLVQIAQQYFIGKYEDRILSE